MAKKKRVIAVDYVFERGSSLLRVHTEDKFEDLMSDAQSIDRSRKELGTKKAPRKYVSGFFGLAVHFPKTAQSEITSGWIIVDFSHKETFLKSLTSGSQFLSEYAAKYSELKNANSKKT